MEVDQGNEVAQPVSGRDYGRLQHEAGTDPRHRLTGRAVDQPPAAQRRLEPDGLRIHDGHHHVADAVPGRDGVTQPELHPRRGFAATALVVPKHGGTNRPTVSVCPPCWRLPFCDHSFYWFAKIK